MKWLLCLSLSLISWVSWSQTETQPSAFWVNEIVIQGNTKTKASIILRELTFQQNDSISIHQLDFALKRSEKNVFNTRLFNFVEIYHTPVTDSTITVIIKVQERWYLWPKFILENADRNFNTWWQNKDLTRLSYGVFIQKFNVRGRNETLQFTVQGGFEQQLTAAYSFPFIDKKKKNGLSFSVGYTNFREVNYTSENNKRLFASTEEGQPLQEIFNVGTTYTRRGGLYIKHQLGVTYHHISIEDSLRLVSDEFLFNNAQNLRYLSAFYTFRFDKRNSIVYPLTGELAHFNLRYRNAPLVSSSTFNLLEASLILNKHHQLSNRWYAGSSLRAKTTLVGTPPYFVQEGLGYDSFVRGYELYVMDAQDYLAVKSHLKFALVPTKTEEIPFIKNKKFSKFFYALYLNLNFDMGFANDDLLAEQNPLSNQWIAGFGAGLDFVSYYDIVIRAEYSRNLENEGGVFLHFKKAF